MNQRKTKISSIKTELLTKSREAMLSAVQVFNNPNIQFKSESFVVLSVISWTYLLHAYYRTIGIEYRYYVMNGSRKKFDKTKQGAHKFWELERCLNNDSCPIDDVTKVNLKFLIGLRHEIEHQMTTRIDDYLSAKFQACCLNYNNYIKKLFDERLGIDRHLTFSLQFSSISEEHANQLREITDLPKHITAYINAFDSSLDDSKYNDMRYSYRVLYIPKTVNRKGQADKVIEFLPANSPEAAQLNKEYVVIKERERQKYLPGQIVALMKKEGYGGFTQYYHTCFWRERDAKKDNSYGVLIVNTWYWYESWLKEVREYCNENGARFGNNL